MYGPLRKLSGRRIRSPLRDESRFECGTTRERLRRRLSSLVSTEREKALELVEYEFLFAQIY